MHLSNLKVCIIICWTKLYLHTFCSERTTDSLFTCLGNSVVLKPTLKELYWRRRSVNWISISSFPDIYFRIFVQFNQLFVTIICFWKHKNLNCMHDDKFWAFRFLSSVLVTMETSYNTMCARKIRQSRTWASQPFFLRLFLFCKEK
jgi:hypothetical protein